MLEEIKDKSIRWVVEMWRPVSAMKRTSRRQSATMNQVWVTCRKFSNLDKLITKIIYKLGLVHLFFLPKPSNWLISRTLRAMRRSWTSAITIWKSSHSGRLIRSYLLKLIFHPIISVNGRRKQALRSVQTSKNWLSPRTTWTGSPATSLELIRGSKDLTYVTTRSILYQLFRSGAVYWGTWSISIWARIAWKSSQLLL